MERVAAMEALPRAAAPLVDVVAERALTVCGILCARAEGTVAVVRKLGKELDSMDLQQRRVAGAVGLAAVAAAAVGMAIASSASDECGDRGPVPPPTSALPAPLPPPRERHVRNDVPQFLEARRNMKQREAAASRAPVARSQEAEMEAEAKSKADTNGSSDGAVAAGIIVVDDDDVDDDSAAVPAADTHSDGQRQRIVAALTALPDSPSEDKIALATAVKAAMEADEEGNLAQAIEQLESVLSSLQTID
jgi:hypothetical protein